MSLVRKNDWNDTHTHTHTRSEHLAITTTPPIHLKESRHTSNNGERVASKFTGLLVSEAWYVDRTGVLAWQSPLQFGHVRLVRVEQLCCIHVCLKKRKEIARRIVSSAPRRVLDKY